MTANKNQQIENLTDAEWEALNERLTARLLSPRSRGRHYETGRLRAAGFYHLPDDEPDQRRDGRR